MAQRIKAALAAQNIIHILGAVAVLSLCGGFVLAVMGRDAREMFGITMATVMALAAVLQPGGAARRSSDSLAEPPKDGEAA